MLRRGSLTLLGGGCLLAEAGCPPKLKVVGGWERSMCRTRARADCFLQLSFLSALVNSFFFFYFLITLCWSHFLSGLLLTHLAMFVGQT